MELFDAITSRHSYRGSFRNKPIPREDLEKIVAAGINAPSGCNQQTTEFVIIDDPQLLASVQAMHPSNTAMQQAQAYICCVVDKQPEPVFEDLSFVVEDCAAATENMLLAITALGYASVWVDGWLRGTGRAESLGRIIGLPENKTVRIILPVGIPAEDGSPAPKKTFGKRAWFNQYNANN